MKRSIYIVWGAGLGVVVIVWWLVWSNAEYLSSDLIKTQPNRIPSHGAAEYVSDVRIGWCDNDGQILESNPFTDSLTITVYLQNFDGWLLRRAQGDQRLLSEDLKPAELARYLSLREQKKKTSSLPAVEDTELTALQVKINHWVLHERLGLRLMLAGQVFESIAPFDATTPATYGSGEFDGETYNRIVFHLTAPNDGQELEKWREIIRAAGPTFSAQISLARPVMGGDPLRLPTLVNADEIYTPGAKPIRRYLPLVPPIRQGAAITAVVFTICAVLAAGLGTATLRDGRDGNLAADQQAPWSLSRIVFAWWLTICVGCFAYLWALMGEYRNIISGSAPLLLGLQGTTLLVAAGFGRAKDPHPSQGFFNDLISEGGEPEIARLQMLVWNFILGIVFIWQSVFQWTMPTFDPTLMTLLGISSATYVGFKFVGK